MEADSIKPHSITRLLIQIAQQLKSVAFTQSVWTGLMPFWLSTDKYVPTGSDELREVLVAQKVNDILQALVEIEHRRALNIKTLCIAIALLVLSRPGGHFIKRFVSVFTDNCYKLLKSLHLIGWEQICQWKTLTKCLMKCPPGFHSCTLIF